MTVTPHDIENKKFTVVRLREGYHQDEVDDFLDNVAVEMRGLIAERNLYRDRSESTIQLPPVQTDVASASRILDLADAEAGRIRSQAESEFSNIVQRAKFEAEEIRREARAEAEKIVAEGTEQKHAEVGRLEDQRQKLEAQVAVLNSHQDQIATRLKAALEGIDA